MGPVVLRRAALGLPAAALTKARDPLPPASARRVASSMPWATAGGVAASDADGRRWRRDRRAGRGQGWCGRDPAARL